MITLRTKFDGRQIEVPVELRGAAPGDVLVIYPAEAPVAQTTSLDRPSIWEAFGKAEHPRSTADIHRQAQAERDSWDER